nr:ATP-NAD kinase family protein [Candidatus Njordarchaeum guaymaensis]
MKLGFLVNPVAGMGGRVGLKGTDEVVKEAVKRGAKPLSPLRAVEFLEALKRSFERKIRFPDVVTCKGAMGEDELKAAGLKAHGVLPIPATGPRAEGYHPSDITASFYASSAQDTKKAVADFADQKVDLIVFVGGDGTARDVLGVLKKSESAFLPPALGVPSGVKMYSGVFALNPVNAAEIVALYSDGKAEVSDLEVMDVDEEAFRSDRLSVRLYGYMKCLYVPMMSQTSKELSPDAVDEKENQKALAKTIIEDMDSNALYILGPGTTVKCLVDMLGAKKTTLGVDLYHKGQTIALDVDEETILKEIRKHGGRRRTWIVVSPIGRQGIIFGRGNQQISPKVIREVGKDHIIAMATKTKVRDIDGGYLKVDTGDKDVDRLLNGYLKVITDYREWRMLQVR